MRRLLGILAIAFCMMQDGCGISSIGYRQTSGTVWLTRDNAFYRTLLDSKSSSLKDLSQDEVEALPFDPERFMEQLVDSSKFQVATFPYIEQYNTKPSDGFQVDTISAVGVAKPTIDLQVDCTPLYMPYQPDIDPLTGLNRLDPQIPVEESEEESATEYIFRFTQSAEHQLTENLAVVIRIDKAELDAALSQMFAVPLIPRFKYGSPDGFDNLVEIEQRLPVNVKYEYSMMVEGEEYSDNASRIYNLGISPG